MANNRKVAAVVMVPFPLQGHLTPLLRLSRRLAAHEIPVYYVGSDTSIRQATARSNGWDPSATANLHFRGFPTPSFQNPPADSSSSDKYPTHLGPMIGATLSRFHEPLSSLVKELASDNHERVVIVFDALMASIVKSVHSLPKVESYVFESASAFNLYAAYWEATGKPEIPPEAAETMREIPSSEGCFSPEFKEFMGLQYRARDFHSGTIFNTSRSTEGLYIDLLPKIQVFGPDKIWAVGPLNPVQSQQKPGSISHSKCLDWLDKQPKNSVLFVSFGTSSSLTQEQIQALALGLEISEVRFVWLLRDADRGNIFEDGDRRRGELPQGFEERVRERGIVEREWGPQLEILEHSATGGFLSHCGWNSCMESISMGVPIVAWPMHSDQPRNSVLITKVLKIGVEVRAWERRGELVPSSTVEEAVRKLMASALGDEMRQRAEKLADSIKQSVKVETDSLIAQITR